MPFELRVPEEGDFLDFMRPLWRGFGEPAPSDEQMEDERSIWEIDRSIGALDGTEWVGGAGAYSLEMTLPGGSTTPVAGVTMVGVATTHRRRGILTSLMRRQLDDVADRGEVAAVLTASESSIYGRYGYGWAASKAHYELASAGSGFRRAADPGGRLQVVVPADSHAPIAAAFDRARLRRAGQVTRSEAFWGVELHDLPNWRDGASALFAVLHLDDAGEADGFATYRIRRSWPDSLPDNTVVVTDLAGADSEVEAALWRFLLDVDLATRIEIDAPIDDPVRWRLLEPRQLRTKSLVDHLWVRLLDVPRALELRRYEAAGVLTVEVVDPFRPASAGRFRLDAGPEGAGCVPTTTDPDLVLGPEELGSWYLGTTTATSLAAAGRIDARPEMLAVADRIFSTSLAPYNATMF